LSSQPDYDHDSPVSAFSTPTRPTPALDFQQAVPIMSNIRTANKRHKRAISATHARNQQDKIVAVEAAKPVKTAA